MAGATGVFDICEDSEHRIWIASKSGVSRFDGEVFKNFQDSLEAQIILKLRAHVSSGVWALSFYGELFHISDEGTIPYAHNRQVRDLLMRGTCYSFYIDSIGTLHVGGSSGYFTIDANGELAWQLGSNDGYNGVGIFPMHQGDPLCFLFSDKTIDETHLYFFDSKKRVSKPIEIPFSISHQGLSTIEYSANSSATLLKVNSNLVLLNQTELIGFQHFGFDFMHAHIDEQFGVWLSNPDATHGATHFYEWNGGEFKLKYTGLEGNSIVSFATDFEGGMWLGTINDGVYYLPEPSAWWFDLKNEFWPFDQIRSTASLSDSLMMATFYGVQGRLVDGKLIKNNLEGKSKGDFGKNVMRLITHDSTKVYALFDYEVYEYTQPEPIRVNDSGNGRIVSISASRKEGVSWIVRNDSVGILSNGRINYVHATPALQAIDLCEDHTGQVWLASFNGLWKLEGDEYVNVGDRFSELSVTIKQIAASGRGIWVLGTNGLHYFENNTLISYSNEELLGVETAVGMAVLKNKLWLNTANGLKCLETNPYGPGHVFANTKFVKGITDLTYSYLGTHEDQLILGINTKLLLLHPEVLQPDTIPISIFVRKFTVNDHDTAFASTLKLSYLQNSIDLVVGAVSFRNASSLRYEYQMIGVDRKPRTTSKRTISYQSLAPGTYEFYVKAITDEGRDSTNEIRYRLRITPPFWRSWWFLLLLFLFLLGMGWGVLQMRFSAALKTREMEKRMVELESSALRAQMNPHFIFNVLGSIQSYMLDNDADAANDYLSQFAVLVRQALANARNPLISLAKEIDALRYYLQLECMRFNQSFSFEIIVGANIDCQHTLIPPLLVQPYVENAIVHGISELPINGTVKIEFAKKGNALICTITDNGPGITDTVEEETNDDHESVGMLVTKERLQILNQSHQVQSHVVVVDCNNQDPTQKGTKVILTLPILKS